MFIDCYCNIFQGLSFWGGGPFGEAIVLGRETGHTGAANSGHLSGFEDAIGSRRFVSRMPVSGVRRRGALPQHIAAPCGKPAVRGRLLQRPPGALKGSSKSLCLRAPPVLLKATQGVRPSRKQVPSRPQTGISSQQAAGWPARSHRHRCTDARMYAMRAQHHLHMQASCDRRVRPGPKKAPLEKALRSSSRWHC